MNTTIKMTTAQVMAVARLVDGAGVQVNTPRVSISQRSTTSVWVAIDLGDGSLVTRISPEGIIEQQRTHWIQRDEHPDNSVSGDCIYNSTNEAHARNLVAEANRRCDRCDGRRMVSLGDGWTHCPKCTKVVYK
jgi:hypothetical protein